MADQLPQQPAGGSTEDFGFRTFMKLDEPFDLGISGDIHDQVDAMVVHQLFYSIDHRDAEILGPREPGRPRVSIGNADDFNRRNQVQKVEKSGPSSSSTEYRNFCRRKLRRHRSIRQRWHGVTPGMEGRDYGPPPTSYQRRGV